jgi:hypothetical protein
LPAVGAVLFLALVATGCAGTRATPEPLPQVVERYPIIPAPRSLQAQAVGNKESEIWPEISSLDLETGDTLLLFTTVGLIKHLADAQITELMAKGDSAKRRATR